MKPIIKVFVLILFISVLFPGCYTIVWDPNQEFPNEANTTDDTNEFYETEYFGGYGDYYEIPWWASLPTYTVYPQNVNEKTKTRTEQNTGRSSDQQNIRNSFGRESTNTGRDVQITTPPPTQSSGSSGTTTTKSTTTTKESSSDNRSSSNNTSSSSNNTRNSSDSGSRDTGSRNTGSGRR